MPRLTRSFYSRSALIVARELLGCILVRRIGGTVLRGRIVETEAYLNDDPASHSFRGITPRTAVMFGPAGHLYVYFTYGMHHCANVVTGKEGVGEAVLLRAVEPLDGVHAMETKRYGTKIDGTALSRMKNLTNGPAKLAKAFGLTTAHSGIDLLDREVSIEKGDPLPPRSIVASTRIGISVGTEKQWRWYVKESTWVSKR